jgi:hypothetical protein
VLASEKSPSTHALTLTIKEESTGVDQQVDLLESNGMTQLICSRAHLLYLFPKALRNFFPAVTTCCHVHKFFTVNNAIICWLLQ